VQSHHRQAQAAKGLAAQIGAFISSSDSGNAGPCRSPRQRTSASGQPYRELGEVADSAIDRERAAVLLGYDLVAYRQAKYRTFAGRFGCEERLEHFLPVFRRDIDLDVMHQDIDVFAYLSVYNTQL